MSKKEINDIYKEYRKIKKEAREIRKKALGRLNDEENANLRNYGEATKTRRAVKTELFGNKGKLKDTTVEIFVEELLKEQEWEYVAQKAVRYLNYDFYLPKFNMLLEVQGSYWHCDPRVYVDGPKNSVQRENLQKNLNKRKIAKEEDIFLLEIWETDILKDPEHTKDRIRKICSDPPIYKLYGLVCPMSGNVKYIGQTSQKPERRLAAHLRESCDVNPHKFSWLNQLKKDNKTPNIFIFYDQLTKKEADDLEIFFIEKFVEASGSLITNIHSGGSTPPGVRMFGESNPFYGLTGSLSPYSIPVVQMKDGKQIKIWNSQIEAADSLSIQKQNINKCLKKKRKSAGGFEWEYLNYEDSKSWFNKKIDDKILSEMFLSGSNLKTMCEFFDSNKETINFRLKNLKLKE